MIPSPRSRAALVLSVSAAAGTYWPIALSAQTASQEPAQKYQVEARFMFWADVAERQSLPDQEHAINDFFVRRARFSLQGHPTESLSFSFQFGQDNIGAKLLNGDGSISIKDAYVNYRASDRVQVTAGQFKVPFLRANLESGFNQLLVDRGTLPSQRPAREGSRDLGVMAWGNLHALQYRLAVFDGTDQEARNDDSSFRVTSRVAWNWFTSETGTSYAGTYLGAKRVLQVAGQADFQSSRLDSRDEASFQTRERDYRAYALEAFFEQPLARAAALTVEGAWLDREDDYLDAVLASRRLQGYYLQGGFLLPGEVGPGRLGFALRRENWDVERDPAEANTSRTSAGLTYYLKGHNRKLQADYTRKHETPEVSNNELRLSAVVVF